MRENGADIKLVCTREREMGGTLLQDLLRACVALLLARVNGFYTLHKTNRFVQSFVLSFVRISALFCLIF